ncbi:hypothetical protein MMC19_007158 [Ptychographa xylographoides]|nr:hypothetical protein [Ptychographa xylographoides]
MAALARIGSHVRTLKFNLPHGPETFLPPLLDCITGEEVTFIYEPSCLPTRNSAVRLSVPTYGSWEMTDLLVKQYPPLFHAAANVSAFIRAFSFLINLKHLKISCPGQESAHRYRRSTVDYALISLRIAVERSPLRDLDTLSLLSVHPGAVLYLNPTMGFGALPNSTRRWRQIRKLAIHMDTIPYSTSDPADHLKLLHAYLQTFSSSVRRLVFRWNGPKGPFPLSLNAEPCLRTPSPPTACPRRCHLALRPLKFPKLRFMEVENATLDASQVSGFIIAHRRSITEFNFEDSNLRTGTWDEALAPLTRISGNEKWKERSEEVMDVPLVLSPVGLEEGQMEKVLRDQEGQIARMRKERGQLTSPVPGMGAWGKVVGARGRGLFWGTEEHMKRFLRSSVFTWR